MFFFHSILKFHHLGDFSGAKYVNIRTISCIPSLKILHVSIKRTTHSDISVYYYLFKSISQKQLLPLIHAVLCLWEHAYNHNLCSHQKKSQMLHFVVAPIISYCLQTFKKLCSPSIVFYLANSANIQSIQCAGGFPCSTLRLWMLVCDVAKVCVYSIVS